MFWVHFAILLLAILVGIRTGGFGLGLIGGAGVTIFTFAFHMKPGSPPIDVMLIILAVVAASATLHAAGGLTYMVQLAEKLLRKHGTACYAYFFFCFYPSDLSAINFDRTGTTHIGKYLLNHSFMIPGFIAVGTATVVGYMIGTFLRV